MDAMAYKALEYVKVHKRFTPADIQKHLNISYVRASVSVDTLYLHGYVDQSGYSWRKGKIKYIFEDKK